MSIELTPLVLPADRPTTLTVRRLTPHEQYVVCLRSYRQGDVVLERQLAANDKGCLCIESTYSSRGEYVVDVSASPAADRLARLHFFVAPPDLYARRPLRGDLHIHTTYSDGRNSCAEMLIRGRELGLDVAVITDHNNYAASVEAIAERERLDLNLITMPGEEVSGPNWHILSVNADVGIHDLARQTFDLADESRYEQWKDTTAWEYDTLCWAIEATRAHGGRAYLAHPYWAVSRGYHLPSAMYDRILRAGILDGLELLGDVKYQNNVRSLARYLDFRAAGHDIPILGNSDTHRAKHTYGIYWTLVLAEDLSPQGVLDAIADGWSVACTTVEQTDLQRRKDALQAFGPFELVDYAYFLEQQFFPMHDALCVEEASLAYRAWRGEKLPDGTMAECKAKMEALYARCWGRCAPGNWMSG